MPDPNESLLARHAASLLQENMDLLKSLEGNHRSDSFNALILPQSETVIEAMGHALAYSAAMQANLPQPVLDIYECAVIRRDSAWYSEQGGLSRLNQRLREDAAVSSMVPQLPLYLSQLEIEQFVQAPIVSDAYWKSYLAELPVHTGSAIAGVDIVQAML